MNKNPVTCDSCGEPIQCLADGWVQWLVTQWAGEAVMSGLSLVHNSEAHQQCMYDHRREGLEDLPAYWFVKAPRFYAPARVHAAYLKRLAGPKGREDVNRVLNLIKRLPKRQRQAINAAASPEPTATPLRGPSVMTNRLVLLKGGLN